MLTYPLAQVTKSLVARLHFIFVNDKPVRAKYVFLPRNAGLSTFMTVETELEKKYGKPSDPWTDHKANTHAEGEHQSTWANMGIDKPTTNIVHVIKSKERVHGVEYISVALLDLEKQVVDKSSNGL